METVRMEAAMYDEVQTATKPMMVEDLVHRLAELRNEKHRWREAGDRIEKQIDAAEAEIQMAIARLKDGLEGNPTNGQIRTESAY